MTLAIARLAYLLPAGLPTGNKFGTQATALPAPPLRKEKKAYGATVSPKHEKRGVSS
jgi:hypothetical protein